ncbi:hypothetical protein LA080_004713 [Diaporthe eres]|nr:hypothetical protein LA080_004713 [Diaporthe eres]
MSQDIVSVEYQEAASTSNHASHSGLPGPSGSSSVNPPNATTSTDTANNIGHLCGAESLSLTVQDILGELRQLTQALKASGPVYYCQDSGNRQEVPAAAVAGANVQQGASTPRRDETGAAMGSSNRENFQAEFRLLDETPQDIYQILNARDELLNLLKGSVKEQWLARELWAKLRIHILVKLSGSITARLVDDLETRSRLFCVMRQRTSMTMAMAKKKWG